MQFIKYALVVSLLSFLFGCAGAAKKDDIEKTLGSESESAETKEQTPFISIPKPAAPEINVPKTARKEFEQAKLSMAKKDWKDAEAKLLLMTETYPGLAGVYVNLGIVYAHLEKLTDAENAYRFAIEKNPLNFDAYTNLGVLLRSKGEFSEAEEVYLAALTLWPHHQPSLINLGVLYDMYMGKLPEALINFELAQKLNETEDKKLKGWIVDLQRRIPSE